jgi:large subunit ribosomal protein L9
MQIILLEKVTKLGNLGDIVKVKNGYARNFLLPRNLARRATPHIIKEFEVKRAEFEKAQAEKSQAAQNLANALDGQIISIAQKAGVDGRLFGSVTNLDISEALKAKGFEVSKSAIRLPQGPVKLIGEFEAILTLHSDVSAKITIKVIPESD